MRDCLRLSVGLSAALLFLSSPAALAGPVGTLTTFTAGTPAKAAEVNGNFTAVKSAVDDNATQIAALESAVTALQATVAAQQSTINTLQSQLTAANSVMALAPYLTVTTGALPRATLSGINLQIINGTGFTRIANGLGNLIIGYDAERTDNQYFCANGDFDDATKRGDTTNPTCTNNGWAWAINHKSGSHYLVIGDGNNYSRYGGVVAGHYNTSNGEYANAIGGSNNVASNYTSSVSGGFGNTASGVYSSVSGGYDNTASGRTSSVSGGGSNKATAYRSSVSGGYGNLASGSSSSVSGGSSRSATADNNWAAGTYSATQ